MQHWKDTRGQTIEARVPAHVEPYVRALGTDKAVEFFLAFGGAPAYIGKNLHYDRNSLLSVIGADDIDALCRELNDGQGMRIDRVPTAVVFIARHLKSAGKAVAEIARILHRADKTIRVYLMDETRTASTGPRARMIDEDE